MQGLGARSRRDLLRKTWVPTGKDLKTLEDEKSVVIRFVVGYRCEIFPRCLFSASFHHHAALYCHMYVWPCHI